MDTIKLDGEDMGVENYKEGAVDMDEEYFFSPRVPSISSATVSVVNRSTHTGIHSDTTEQPN